MFVEIHQLKESGFKKSQISRRLNLDRKTITKYWDMGPDQFADTIKQASTRPRKLDKYESVVRKWLEDHPDITAAQIEDWLKEHFHDKSIKERTVRSYVVHLREKYNIPKNTNSRQYQALEDPPMGHQMQLDFGEKKVMGADHKKKKLYALGSVLSNSRYKYAEWSDRPLTTNSLIAMLLKCFNFYGGIPREIVIDQDKLMVVSENFGEIIYTHQFEQFRKKMGFQIYLCRASDPESKGRVEAVVKYVKYGFAANRTFTDLDSWNQLCINWLDRTANRKIHGTTKKVPAEVFSLEKQYLSPVPSLWKLPTDSVTRNVRKDNTIIYESNRYSVPINTYAPGLEVKIHEQDGKLIISALDSGKLIAEHPLSKGKGELVQNRNHLRDYKDKVDKLYHNVLVSLNYIPELAHFLDIIRKEKGRYIRDQYKLILKLHKTHSQDILLQAFTFCRENELYSAVSLKQVADYLADSQQTVAVSQSFRANTLPEHLRITANVRDIEAYASLVQGGEV